MTLLPKSPSFRFCDHFSTEKHFVSVLGLLLYGKALRFGFGITFVRKAPFRFWDHFGTESPVSVLGSLWYGKPRFGFGITLVRKAPFRFWDHFGTESPVSVLGLLWYGKPRFGFGITLVRKRLFRTKVTPKRIHSASNKDVTTCGFDTYHTFAKVVPHES